MFLDEVGLCFIGLDDVIEAFRIGGIKMISACTAREIGARYGLAVCQRTADQFLRTCPVQSHAAL